ncbi:MAG: hypothetical protein LBK70_03780 [Clostridiales bacterium]|nr:hypothetical protein [Clostridiales bacterium]
MTYSIQQLEQIHQSIVKEFRAKLERDCIDKLKQNFVNSLSSEREGYRLTISQLKDYPIVAKYISIKSLLHRSSIDKTCSRVSDEIWSNLCLANIKGELDVYVSRYGVEHFVTRIEQTRGKICILGDSCIARGDIYSILGDFGIALNRVNFVDYYECRHYNIVNLCDAKYSAIIAGAVPHSGMGMGKSSSILVELERLAEVGLLKAKVVRLIANNQLKITANNLRECLANLTASNTI